MTKSSVNSINTYIGFRDNAENELDVQKKKSRLLSILRFLDVAIFLVSVYYFLFDFSPTLAVIFTLSFFVFIFLVSKHQKVKENIERLKEEIELNNKEILFLQNNYYPFPDGIEYLDGKHPYSQDLDILGDHGIFQYLNRCHSQEGNDQLAASLLQNHNKTEILENQEMVEDLKDRSDFRNDSLLRTALAKLDKDRSKKLRQWSDKPADPMPSWLPNLSYIICAIMWALIIYFLIRPQEGALLSVLKYGCATMLILFLSQAKRIRSNMESGEKWKYSILQIYQMFMRIQSEKFQATELQNIVQKAEKDTPQMKQLLYLLNQLQSVENPLGSMIINAILPFHIFYYQKYSRWQSQNQGLVSTYISVIGKLEYLLSLSQYAYNNPHLSKPEIIDEEDFVLENGIHPLMSYEDAVANSISFTKTDLYILTGSNMSGKSTFLRTVGLIRVLAMAGSYVSASRAQLSTSPLLCFMRVEDSITKGASFFKAELNRLSEIMQKSAVENTFVLLDEILKGTNSDDKRKGTIGVLEKLLRLETQGILATHDLEVCNMADLHPIKIANVCFESEVINGQLVFDYTLRPGICHNTNASYLLKEEGII